MTARFRRVETAISFAEATPMTVVSNPAGAIFRGADLSARDLGVDPALVKYSGVDFLEHDRIATRRAEEQAEEAAVAARTTTQGYSASDSATLSDLEEDDDTTSTYGTQSTTTSDTRDTTASTIMQEMEMAAERSRLASSVFLSAPSYASLANQTKAFDVERQLSDAFVSSMDLLAEET